MRSIDSRRPRRTKCYNIPMSISFTNGGSVGLGEIPTLSFAEFEGEFEKISRVAGARVLALWCLADARVVCVLGNPETKKLEAFAVPRADYRPLARKFPTVQRFERELFGDPDLEPVTPLKGEAAHEVAVGPVHAGVIEPGHFRFQCMGEDVYALEIRLGYQHRGAERLMVEAKSDARRLALAETVAGDTSIAATLAATKALNLAYSPIFSNLSDILLELERIANHVGDLGALSGDVAYLPTASFCGRIRGEYLNMTAEFVGNRFGRNALLASAPTPETYKKVLDWFVRTEHELFHALDLLFAETGAVERFEDTGKVPRELAASIGLVGMAGRASGLKTDSRVDFPFDDERIRESLVSSAYEPTGDVLSRARQRYEELKVSHAIVRRLLSAPLQPLEPIESSVPRASSLTVAVVEAWRGELVHLAVRGADGALEAYKIFDPSYHNWFGLAQALKGEQISNFPICNKSFNLSYCGVDR